MMRAGVAIANIILGLVYTSYGIMTIVDLKRGWRTMGLSHFGLAWIAMAFTCGPHHLEHGLHVALAGCKHPPFLIGLFCHIHAGALNTTSAARLGGPLDLAAVLVGFPAGVIWFLLRVEALSGGRGDRFVSGTPRWVAALPALIAVYVLALGTAVVLMLAQGAHFGPKLTPNVLLLGVYSLIGYYLLRTQLANRSPLGGWSVSGLALTVVFPTCGLMHAVFAAYAAGFRYDVDWPGLVIDWLAVPAAVYFVWVVRSLYLGTFRDWNPGVVGAQPEPVAV
jgi:hypothetical protein